MPRKFQLPHLRARRRMLADTYAVAMMTLAFDPRSAKVRMESQVRIYPHLKSGSANIVRVLTFNASVYQLLDPLSTVDQRRGSVLSVFAVCRVFVGARWRRGKG